MADQLGDGGKIRFLTVIDVFTREALAIEVGERLRGEDLPAVLNRLVRQRGAPSAMFVDNGAGFTGQIVDLWAYHHKVRMDFSGPGTPTDNAHIGSFNSSFRDYNESRPHMALNGLSQAELARQQGTCDKKGLVAVGYYRCALTTKTDRFKEGRPSSNSWSANPGAGQQPGRGRRITNLSGQPS